MAWQNLIPSGAQITGLIHKQKLLLHDGPVYLMDNHQTALWCWLKEISLDQQYNLLHIDRHYDCLPVNDSIEIALNGRKIHQLSISDYLCLNHNYGHDCVAPVFRYDDYIPAWESRICIPTIKQDF